MIHLLFKYALHCSTGKTDPQYHSFKDYLKFPFHMKNNHDLIKSEESEQHCVLLRTLPSEKQNEI
jgi:hypothetical protein